MAFSHKLGGLARQNLSLPGATSAMSAAMNCVRYMSSKLFVGGLSYGTDDMSLRDAFSAYGDVTEARVILDRDTGRSRGFGFVSFNDSESANSALNAMDGKELQGRNIRVSLANDRPSAPRNFGNYNTQRNASFRGEDDGF